MSGEARLHFKRMTILGAALALLATTCGPGLVSATVPLGPIVVPSQHIGPLTTPGVTFYPNGTGNNDSSAPKDLNLVYGGGAVLASSKVFITYWNWGVVGDPDNAAPYVEGFFAGVGGSGYANIQTQYWYGPDNASFIQNPTDIFGGAWHDDSGAVPMVPDASTSSVFVEQEVLRAEAHFGYEPDGLYFVMLPHGYFADLAQGYCGYHFNMNDAQGRDIAYSVVSYVSDFPTVTSSATGDVATCGTNRVHAGPEGRLDGFSMVTGHEWAEAVTDKDPNSGWSASDGENADKCVFVPPGPTYPKSIHLSTGDYAVQSLWSNADKGCAFSWP